MTYEEFCKVRTRVQQFWWLAKGTYLLCFIFAVAKFGQFWPVVTVLLVSILMFLFEGKVKEWLDKRSDDINKHLDKELENDGR